MIRAYLFALDPTDAQTEALRSHCGAQRYAFKLRTRAGARQPGSAGRRTQLRHLRRSTHPGGVVVGVRPASSMERSQAPAGAVVGGELEGGVFQRAGQPRHRAVQLGGIEIRYPDRPESRIPPIQVPPQAYLDRSLAALRRAQREVSRRRGPDRRTRQVPSNRWRKAKARVTALHTRVTNSRRDGLHQLTTRLVRGHDTIVIEDLHVTGMNRNRRLARHIAGLGMAEFRRQIEYKAADAGVSVVVADRWYPSSKTCSACGAVRAKLTLAERQFVCETCGTRIDRDFNAAMNLAALADQDVLGELRPDVKLPAGNPRKIAIGGNGYSHGKTQVMSQRRPREVVAP